MSRLLLLPLLLLVACDSAEETSPLVGTWVATSSRVETVATSSTAQSVPDLSAEGTGGITVSGDVTDRLTYVSLVHRDRVNNLESVTFSAVRQPVGASGVVSVMEVVQNEGHLDRIFLTRYGAPRDGYYVQGTYATPLALRYQNGRFTLSPTVLPANDGSGAQVTVGGTLTLPLLTLRPGEAATVYAEEVEPDDYRITFDADGTFRVTPGGDLPQSGTWRTEGSNVLVLSGQGLSARIPYVLTDGRLQISADLATVCDSYCLEELEGRIYASPGTLSNVRTVGTDTFERAGGA